MQTLSQKPLSLGVVAIEPGKFEAGGGLVHCRHHASIIAANHPRSANRAKVDKVMCDRIRLERLCFSSDNYRYCTVPCVSCPAICH